MIYATSLAVSVSPMELSMTNTPRPRHQDDTAHSNDTAVVAVVHTVPDKFWELLDVVKELEQRLEQYDISTRQTGRPQ